MYDEYEKLLEQQHRRRVRRLITAALALFIVAATVWPLVLPGLSTSMRGSSSEYTPISVDLRNTETQTRSDNVEIAYTIAAVEAEYVTDGLDGNSFLIASDRKGNDPFYLLTSINTAGTGGTTWLKYSKGWMRYKRIVGDGDMPIFTFTKFTELDPDLPQITQQIMNRSENRNNMYMVTTEVDGNTMYLHLDNLGSYLAADKAVITVNASHLDGHLRLRQPAGLNNKAYYLNLKSNGDRGVFQTYGDGQANDVNSQIVLIRVKPLDMTVVKENHTAAKESVSLLEDGDTVVIYRSVWDPDKMKYELFAIDGYGNLVPVTDRGGTIGWYTVIDDSHKYTSTVEWRFTIGRNTDNSESGYYWLQNTATGAYLAPRAHYDYSGNKIEDTILAGDDIVAGTPASFEYSMQLEGRGRGEYSSTIVSWSNWDGTEGLHYLEDPSGTFGYVLVRGGYEDADNLDFARVVEVEELLTVETLDTASMGVQIYMYDYESRQSMSDSFGSNAIGSVTDTKRTWFVPGLLEKTLNADGLPVAALNNNVLDELFTGGKPANHLFLESAYSETGYYEYSSALNYAYFNSDGNFTVYNQLGAPEANRPEHRMHGHFMPYNQLLESVWTEKNQKDEFLHDLPPDDPMYGRAVHKIQTGGGGAGDKYNYNFGMSIEVDFLQMYNKVDQYGNDLIFEFTGDDDLFLFVDDVLVLDLGGIHSALYGKVNFTTGQISYDGDEPRDPLTEQATSLPPLTIKECFRSAGVFPDGTPWTSEATAEQIAEYFDGDTFKADFFGHKLKIFYLERGKNASNLHMRFNLVAVKKDTFLVTKEITGTENQDYTDKTFLYQAFKDDGTPLTDAKVATQSFKGVWSETNENVVFYDNVVIGGQAYNNVFKLKSGEGASFSLPDSDSYYVVELGIDPSEVSSVSVNYGSEPLTVTPNAGDNSLYDHRTTVRTPRARRQVNFQNECVTQELRLTKQLEIHGEQPDPGATFEFRFMMGPDEQHIKNYSIMPYYIVKNEGGTEVYYYRIDGKMVPLTLGSDGKYYYDNNGTLTLIPKKDPTDPIFDYSSRNGYISGVPAGFTILFKGVLPGTVFSTYESSMPQGFSIKSIEDAENTSFDTLSDPDDTTLTGQIRLSDDASVIAVNLYAEGSFRLIKVSSESTSTPVPGATFELYGGDPDYVGGAFRFYSHDLITTLESGSDGYLFVLSDGEGEGYYGADAGDIDLKLGTGTYYLYEKSVPAGYSRAAPIIAFRIAHTGELTILGPIAWDDVNEEITYLSRPNTGPVNDTVIGGVTSQTGMISNIPGSALPATGGGGTLKYYITGGTLIVASLVLILILNEAGRMTYKFKAKRSTLAAAWPFDSGGGGPSYRMQVSDDSAPDVLRPPWQRGRWQHGKSPPGYQDLGPRSNAPPGIRDGTDSTLTIKQKSMFTEKKKG